MSTLFDRRWRVQVGTFDVSDLDCKFKIKRGLGTHGGSCELEVYNLTEDHRNALHATPRTVFVQIDAGYASGISRLFQGTSRRINLVREKTDWLCKITAGDGEYGIRSARIAQGFPAGTTIPTVVQSIATAMGVGAGNALTALAGVRFVDGTAAFPGGTVAHGLASRELTTLCDAVGLEWSIQDGTLLLLPIGGALQRDAIVLAPDSGLLDSPQVGKKNKLKATCLLVPGLGPGCKVQLVSAGTNGFFRVEKIEFEGETRGPPWEAKMDLSAWPPPARVAPIVASPETPTPAASG